MRERRRANHRHVSLLKASRRCCKKVFTAEEPEEERMHFGGVEECQVVMGMARWGQVVRW